MPFGKKFRPVSLSTGIVVKNSFDRLLFGENKVWAPNACSFVRMRRGFKTNLRLNCIFGLGLGSLKKFWRRCIDGLAIVDVTVYRLGVFDSSFFCTTTWIAVFRKAFWFFCSDTKQFWGSGTWACTAFCRTTCFISVGSSSADDETDARLSGLVSLLYWEGDSSTLWPDSARWLVL